VVDHNIATDAIELLEVEREQDYGDAADNMKRIADLWGAYLGVSISRQDAAVMMSLLKLARMKGRYKRDNAVDAVAYVLLADTFGRYRGYQ